MPSVYLSFTTKTKAFQLSHTTQMVSKHSRKRDVISHSLLRCVWCMVDVACFFYTSISPAFWAHHMVWQSVTHFSLLVLKSNQGQFKDTVQPKMLFLSSCTHPHVVIKTCMTFFFPEDSIGEFMKAILFCFIENKLGRTGAFRLQIDKKMHDVWKSWHLPFLSSAHSWEK